MAIEIKMPQLSDTMSSGKIVIWKKKEGDKVARGEALAEVETDKANLEIECFHPGVLIKIVVPEGDNAAVGSAIAFIGEAGETAPSTNGTSANGSSVNKSQPISAPTAQVTTISEPHKVADPIVITSSSDRIIVSPLAKRIAQDSNLDLTMMRGSGPGGRIVKKDVDAAISNPATASIGQVSSHQITNTKTTTTSSSSSTQQSTQTSSSSTAGFLTPFSKMRETIARRMQESMTTSPHFYVTSSIKMDETAKLRELLKERPEYKGISVNHLVIKAAAYAIAKEPSINCSVKDGQLYSPAAINIGIVTAIPDGLLIPVIKDANKLSLRDIVFEARAAIERAKAGRPSSSDLSGGTFSISNMGMFDVENFTAIINPGQGAILAISSTKEVAIVEKGQVVIAKQMKVTLSSDHRIIDGIMVANFLKHFKEALEYPALLALE